MQQENASLRSELDAAKKSAAAWQERGDGMVGGLERLNEELSALKIRFHGTELELAACQAERDGQVKGMERLNEQLSALKIRLHTSEAELEQCRATESQETHNLREERDACRAELQEAKKQDEIHWKTRRSLNAELEVCKATSENQAKEIHRLIAELEECRKVLRFYYEGFDALDEPTDDLLADAGDKAGAALSMEGGKE